jgi:two-component system sensor histidine kinase KdpD
MPALIPFAAREPMSEGRRYALALLACVIALAVALPLREVLDLANTVMLFLLAVVLVASRLGRGPALIASLVSVALFDYFFVPPRFSFAVSHGQYLVTFAVMLAVSLIVGQLTAGLRSQARDAERREQATRALYDLAKDLAGVMQPAQVELAVRDFMRTHLGARLWLLLAPGDVLTPLTEAAGHLAALDLQMARMAFDGGMAVESGATDEAGFRRHFLPLTGASRRHGVLVASMPDSAIGDLPLLEALASLVATAVERLYFVDIAQSSQLEAESERLRSSILSALSHDVRTPLTALYGLADSLVLARPPLSGEQRETACAIRDQALRVNGMVGKLLDMARLQAGRVNLRKEWQPIEEVVGASLQLLGSAMDGHPVQVSGLGELPLVKFDAVLLERVFCNLFENAAKYAPAHTPIQLAARVAGAFVEVQVRSGGPGFPPDRLERVFGLFERGAAEMPVVGVGVGLAICRSIVEAHGGSIRAFNPPEGGGCVVFTLPLGTPPAIEPEAPEGGSGE